MPVATKRPARAAPRIGKAPDEGATRPVHSSTSGSVLDKLGQGLCVFDGAHRLALFNRRYAEIYGIAQSALRVGMGLPEVIDLRFAAGTGPDMPPEAYAAWRDRIAVEDRVSDTVVRLRDGRSIAVHHEPTPDGGWVSTHDDITERVRAEARLSESEARLRALTDALPQMVWLTRTDGDDTTYRNAQFERFFGPIGTSLADRIATCHPDDADRLSEAHRAALAQSQALSVEARLRRIDGAHRWHKLSLTPIRRGDTVAEWLGTALDIHEIVTARREFEETSRQLRTVLENMDQGLIVLDGGRRVRLHNRRARELLGLSEQILHAGADYAQVRRHQRATGEFLSSSSHLVGALEACDLDSLPSTYERQRPDGTVLEVRAVTQSDGGYVRTFTDVTARHAAETRLRASEQRLTLALDAGSDGLWDCDLATGAAWSSERWWRMLGYEPGELESHARTWRALLHPEDAPRAERALTEHLKGGAAAYECEHRLRRKDGTWAWMLTRGRVVERGPDGAPLRFVGTQIDISARKAAEGQIAHMARHDALTDLPNRALFHERLAQKLAEVRRYGGSCAVLCLDLDRFKMVNDTLGHLAGDTLLCAVAERLRASLRAEDTIARLGGDEFAILLGGTSEPSSVALLADRLIAAVDAPVLFGDQRMQVGLSVGIALAPEHGASGEEVFKRADLALYRAKAEGRGTHRFFEPAMDAAAAERRDLERDLRRAIESGELILHYQPQVATSGGDLVGFEALVRWVHPERGLISPASFIPLAEESGLIGALGEWVLRAACREAARWGRPLKVAVNLSPRQFQQADLPERVLAILTETGLSPTRLELEVTESVIINDMARALGILRRLKAFGISISIDDFGTGYSSLATLQAFPFDKIKIDRSFVGLVEASPQAAVIVRAVLGLGRSLGMGVVAEGVETAEQMRFLAAEACEEVQGYLVGRPQPIEQFTDAVRTGVIDGGPSGAVTVAA